MSIFGYIDEIEKNVQFNHSILEGLNYLRNLTSDSFSKLKHGDSQKIPLDGDRLFSLNQIYTTRSMDQARFEGHRKYIDLQYLFEGFETIRSSSLKDCRPQGEYDAKNDVQFFTSDFFTPIHLKPNMVCILYPDDIHAPGLILNSSGFVKKAVIKVSV
ncbi:MAG: DUF386 domain-containing protein [Desulfobacteraceae bacterium]|nr:MAG: DUF386 domain-containing protein [Desulfobacteraceae bacterium]